MPLIGSISHIVAAFLFAGVALWGLLRPKGGMRRRSVAGAALITVLWSASVAVHGDDAIISRLLESARNVAWLGLMFLLLLRAQRDSRHNGVFALYAVIGTIILVEIGFDLVLPAIAETAVQLAVFSFVSIVLRMMVAVGALVLVHNLYGAAAPEARWGIRLPMIALALMWVYDLNLYTTAYLTETPTTMLFAGRGIVMILAAGLIGLSSRHDAQWKMRLSRAVTFRSLSLLAIGIYLAMMMLIVRALEITGIAKVELVQVSVVIGMSMLAIASLPSRTLRAWLRVKLIKHFFQHRYDYRSEWLRFTDTLGSPDPDAAPLNERVIKALADITESPGGALLLLADDGGLSPAARWGWADLDAPQRACGRDFVQQCERDGRAIELEAIRSGRQAPSAEPEWTPAWMIETPRAWAVVPLIHFGRLLGMVMLERPLIDRQLDWEDFDLLRLASRQVASYLAEASSQEALSDARRFDEFNRRFAFIMHDIKNLVSQLTLVARNAERHAANPAFREDMIATLQGSAGKMTDLLARLAPHDRARAEEPEVISLKSVAQSVRATCRALVEIEIEGGDIEVVAQPHRLAQAVTHLVQNAIDAGGRDRPVTIRIDRSEGEAVLSVIDRGEGMSADFIRNSLFRPFSSTKPNGFGIGAHEARVLVTVMGGRIDVTSHPGEGSRFDVILPIARHDSSEIDRAPALGTAFG